MQSAPSAAASSGATMPAAETERFLQRLTDLSSGRVQAQRAGQEYRAFPVQKEEP